MKEKILKQLKYMAPDSLKRLYRSYMRKIKKQFLLPKEEKKPLSLIEFEDILENKLNIKTGDTLIVHSSFGNLNADFTPLEAVECLKSIVGDQGNLLMPFYPTGHAYYWIQDGNVFDVHKSKSSMGVLTQVFKESEGVIVSPHPVKALSAWGKDKDWLVDEHHLSPYPYGKLSPYYKTVLLPNSKTVGLGIEINSFGHCCEDLFLTDKSEIYLPKLFNVKFNYYDGVREISTYLHDPKKVNGLMSICEFLKISGFKYYIGFTFRCADYFSTDNHKVINHLEPLFLKGFSRSKFQQHKLK